MKRLLLCMGWTLALAAHAGLAEADGLIVRLRTEAAADSIPQQHDRAMKLLAQHRAPLQVAGHLTGDWQQLLPSQPMSPEELRQWAAQLRADPRVLAAVPDVREQRMGVTPADARFGEQWWLQAVASGNTGAAGFSTAWTRSTGAPVRGQAAVVAVLDSGITSHPELNTSRLLPGYDFVSNVDYANDGNGRDNDPSDPGDAVTAADKAAYPALYGNCATSPLASWHGTLIAGQLAAVSNNTEGVAATDWNTRLLPVRVAGKCGAALSDIIDGMRWAAGLHVAGVPDNPNPARVIVLAYGGSDPCDANSATPEIAQTAQLYLAAIDEVRRLGAGGAGSMVVVAAGNEDKQVGRPASCTGAFAVASLNREGFKAKYSNFGAQIALATPGGDGDTGVSCDNLLADTGIVSTGNLGDTSPGAAGYAAGSGTSFAAPTVAGVASLMLALNPDLTLAQLEDGLKRSARPHVLVPQLGDCESSGAQPRRCACTTATCGAGILDADQALVYAQAPDAYTAPSRTGVSLTGSKYAQCATALGRPQSSPTTDPTPTPPAPGSSGGGAFSGLWLLGLVLALGLLAPSLRD